MHVPINFACVPPWLYRYFLFQEKKPIVKSRYFAGLIPYWAKDDHEELYVILEEGRTVEHPVTEFNLQTLNSIHFAMT